MGGGPQKIILFLRTPRASFRRTQKKTCFPSKLYLRSPEQMLMRAVCTAWQFAICYAVSQSSPGKPDINIISAKITGCHLCPTNVLLLFPYPPLPPAPALSLSCSMKY